MPVTLISSPAELPADAPPGLMVMMVAEPASAAEEAAQLLELAPPCTPSEAAARLDAGNAAGADSSSAAAAAQEREAALHRARQEAAEALDQVPASARGVDPERLYRAAAAVRAAHVATVDARELLGERPELSLDAAEAALAADQATVEARRRRTVGVDRSATLLLAANAVGILIVAGRLRTPLVDPLFVLVAACPLTALAYLVVTVVSRTRETRAAVRARAEALRRTGMATMTGLAARHARVKAWKARADAVAAAEASLAEARRRWTSLAGPSADPAKVDSLVDAVARAERASAAVVELEAAHAATPVPGPPRSLVVVIDAGADEPLDDETRDALDRLRDGSDATMVVVVTACSAIRSWAEGHAGGRVGEVLDLRERVLASLERLRARAAGFADGAPPGSMAAGG